MKMDTSSTVKRTYKRQICGRAGFAADREGGRKKGEALKVAGGDPELGRQVVPYPAKTLCLYSKGYG